MTKSVTPVAWTNARGKKSDEFWHRSVCGTIRGVETVTIGSAGAAIAMAVTITMFGVLTAAAVLALFRKRVALAVLVVPVLLGLLSWWLYLTPFYAVDLSDDTLRLRSPMSVRTVELRRDEIASIDRQTKVTKNDYSVTLVVRTRDGRTFTSGNTTVNELFPAWQRVDAWLSDRREK